MLPTLQVLLAQLKNTEKYFAMKVLKKDVVIEDDDVEATLVERRILALGTECPFITQLHCTFQTEVRAREEEGARGWVNRTRVETTALIQYSTIHYVQLRIPVSYFC